MGIKGIIRFFGVRAFEGIIAILLVTFMPNIPPNAKFSQPYSVTPSLALEGKLALNERLNQAEIWHKGDFIGPEAFAEYNGELYTTIHGGDVVKLTGNHITPVVKFGRPCKGVYQEQICGRPLGLTFDKNGALYVADAYYGIFKVDVKTGKQLQLVSVDHEIDGKKPKLPNNIAVTSNGDIYWSDSSTEFTLQDGLFDMFADGSGRLIHYDAKTKKNTVLMDGVHFANGVILSNDESFVLVAETGRSRIHRYYLKGPKKGQNDVFLDGLPGLPDNLNEDGHGGFLVPLVMARDSSHPSASQIFGPFPLVRKFISRVFGLTELGFKLIDQVYPNEWAERGIHWVGHFTSLAPFVTPPRVTVLHVSNGGEILDSLHALDKKIIGISEAFIFKDHLYLGSPFNDYIARVTLAKAGLKHLAPIKQTRSPPVNQTPPPTQAPKVTTPTPTQAPKITTPPPTQAPKVTTPPPTQAPKVTTPPPTQAPKVTTPPPTQAPKVTTPPPTQAPKVTTPPPTQAPKVTTPPPTQVPKVTTPPPTQAPKVTTTPPKQAPKVTTPSPTQAPKVTTPPPTKVPKATPTAAPTKTPPSQQTKQTPPSTPPPTAKQPTKETVTQRPPSQEQEKQQPKVVPDRDIPKTVN